MNKKQGTDIHYRVEFGADPNKNPDLLNLNMAGQVCALLSPIPVAHILPSFIQGGELLLFYSLMSYIHTKELLIWTSITRSFSGTDTFSLFIFWAQIFPGWSTYLNLKLSSNKSTSQNVGFLTLILTSESSL